MQGHGKSQKCALANNRVQRRHFINALKTSLHRNWALTRTAAEPIVDGEYGPGCQRIDLFLLNVTTHRGQKDTNANTIFKTTSHSHRQIALPRFLTTMENDFSHHLNQLRSSVPALTSSMHKGDAGRIGVVGGSLEYTGAPYFAAITALTVGADLVHVFCAKSAGPVIKSYSPELIVHPILDDACCVEIIKQWLPHLHVVVIGPGLGRDQTTISAICRLITTCMKLKKPLVIDADGLFLLTQQFHLITNYDGLILTPNAAEFRRVFGENHSEKMRDMNADITVLEKGQTDRVWDAKTGEVVVECPAGGSNRRCGGQGDLLCGAVAVFYCWGLMAKLPPSEAARAACCAGSLLTKECNRKAFARRGRAMVTSDMVEEIAGVFRDDFEIKL